MKYLLEVSFLRPILALMVIIYHAFIVYGGGWSPPEGYIDIPVYGKIAGVVYNGMLETFVFLSGYVFYYSMKANRHQYTIITLIKAKFKRLIIPAWIWSILYFILIDSETPFISIIKMGGVIGHLWFLPMLFWCFLLTFLLGKYVKGKKPALVICISLLIVSWLPIPFQISKSFYYLIYFFMGTIMYSYKDLLTSHLRLKHVLLVWIASILIYMVVSEVHINLSLSDSIMYKILSQSFHSVLLFITSLPVVISMYFTSILITREVQLNRNYVKIGTYCMGVYVFQQFILKYLYYHTSLPLFIDPFLLPFAGIAIAVVLSLSLSMLIKQNSLLSWLL